MMLDFLEYLAFNGLNQLVRPLSFGGVNRLGGWLGSVGFRFLRIRRSVTMTNLRNAFPEKDPSELESIAEGAYRSFGKSILLMLWARYATEEELRIAVRIPDRTVIDRCLSAGKGVVLLSAHFGCWEFIAHGLRLNIGRPLALVVQRQRNRRIDRIIDRIRRRHGNQTVGMGVQSREALTVLLSGGILGLLGDQSGPRESIFVDFFGRPAATHRGPAAFSLRTGSPLVFVVLVRQPDETYEALLEEIHREGLEDHSDESILELTRRHVSYLEGRIRAYPDQWLWMHKRWKHTPGNGDAVS